MPSAGLEDVQRKAVRAAPPTLLSMRELLRTGLRLPEGREAAQAVAFLVDPAEALGEPREVEAHPELRQRDEARLLGRELPRAIALLVDGGHRRGGEGGGLVDRVVGQRPVAGEGGLEGAQDQAASPRSSGGQRDSKVRSSCTGLGRRVVSSRIAQVVGASQKRA
jgi:hypothetical protein